MAKKKKEPLTRTDTYLDSLTVSSPLTSWPGTHSQHKASQYFPTHDPGSCLNHSPPQCPHRAAQSRMRSIIKVLVSRRHTVLWLHSLATSRSFPFHSSRIRTVSLYSSLADSNPGRKVTSTVCVRMSFSSVVPHSSDNVSSWSISVAIRRSIDLLAAS